MGCAPHAWARSSARSALHSSALISGLPARTATLEALAKVARTGYLYSKPKRDHATDISCITSFLDLKPALHIIQKHSMMQSIIMLS